MRTADYISFWIARGAAAGAVLGGLSGLILGLLSYPPTALIAVLEAGIPGAILGGIIGLVLSLLLMIGDRLRELLSSRARLR